ncbi:hypothetical protein Zmor_024202 [Zophobas morio]|uniref:Uncharacterized protein n=1 Tax=Zophobas morio TaxID=2755281 RepID=A0AA38HZS5_9CUCU|nr:hypothetical protein Zmor_024202 [Zophobas morio]
MVCFVGEVYNVIGVGARDISNAIVVLDHQLQGEAHNINPLNGMCRKTKNSQYFGGVNKAPKEVKIGSFTRDSSLTIPGKINGTSAAITIDTGVRYQLYVEDS